MPTEVGNPPGGGAGGPGDRGQPDTHSVGQPVHLGSFPVRAGLAYGSHTIAIVRRRAAVKKLINDPADVVAEALRGIEAAHPDLGVDHQNKIVHRSDAPVRGKVGLVSGGGSGHEPLHGGFVGPGMLDAACAGEVFTSPVPDQVIAATRLADGGAGVLHIVKNYTGDVLNFEMAAELATADTGIEIASVVVDDDVAVQDSLYTAGRRGVGTTVLLEKIAGAAADEGRDLAGVAEIARRVNASGRSMGMALTSCTVPAAGHPTFELPEGEMEIGIGIHGEPGRKRVPLAPARDVAAMLLEPILDDLDFTGGDGVLAFVNGMGGTPMLELYLMYNEVAQILGRAGVTVVRSLVGPYITSLEMAGCSVTLLKLDDELLRLWDAPVSTPGLRWGV
jgi:phosphoenolpyruvate---glycerone phosphotransferase subunit DhaK